VPYALISKKGAMGQALIVEFNVTGNRGIAAESVELPVNFYSVPVQEEVTMR
jgi:hypothetical protein